MKRKDMLLALMLPALLLTSCSTQEDGTMSFSAQDEQTAADGQELSAEGAVVTFNLTRASSDDGSEISELTFFVYQEDKQTDSLVYVGQVELGDGTIQLTLPLDEDLETFAVAGLPSYSDEDSLATLKLHLDAECQSEVWISNIVSFTSDYTTTNVELELSRLVGQCIVEPKETTTELSSFGKFDQVQTTLSNVATTYLVNDGSVEVEDITVSATSSDNYQVSVYSFPTTSASVATGINMTFLKSGAQVNSLAASIDAGIVFEASKRTTVSIPFTDDTYMATPWSSAAKRRQPSVGAAPFYSISETIF